MRTMRAKFSISSASKTGHDFSKYKNATVLRRIVRRMQIAKKENIADYFTYMQENVEEVQALFGDLLISVTTFFRDPKAFETLARVVIPRLFDGRGDRRHHPRLGSGLRQRRGGVFDRHAAARRSGEARHASGAQVFGSDLNASGLAVAREGRYPFAIEADVSEERLHRFFSKERRVLSGTARAAGGDFVRQPQPAQGSAVRPARSHLLPQSPHLSRSRRAAAGVRHLPLCAEADGLPVSRHGGKRRQPAGSVPCGRQGCPHLPVDRAAEPSGRCRCRSSSGAQGGSRRCRRRGRRRRRPAASTEETLHRQALEMAAPPSVLVDERHRVVHLSETAGRFLQPPRGPLHSDLTELVRRGAALRSARRPQPGLRAAREQHQSVDHRCSSTGRRTGSTCT